MRHMLLSLCVVFCSSSLIQAKVPCWGRWEGTFERKAADTNKEFYAELMSPSGKIQKVLGFWDGGTTWKVRFMPTELGTWEYRTEDQAKGSFECVVNVGKDRFSQHGPIRIAKSGTHLEHADGTPFFWLGDTVWNGAVYSTKEDWAKLLKDRQEKQFTGIQFVPHSGWRITPKDPEGRVSFEGTKDIQIHPEYFKRIDERFDAINQAGMLAAPVLMWANRKTDPGNVLPEADIIKFCRYQIARYGSHHLLWILGGDNKYDGPQADRWKRIGRAVFAGQPNAVVTTHPTGMNWPWETWRDEKWLNVLGYQSGHGDDAKTLEWIHSGPVKQNWTKTPVRPIINLEPPYEDHNGYQSRKPHTPLNVRRAVYWSLLCSPVAGVTYGGHGVWSWQSEEGKEPLDHKGTGIAKLWHQALQLPASAQMKHVYDIFTGIEWWRLRPDDTIMKQPAPQDPFRYVAAAGTEKGDLILIYTPVGGTLEFHKDNLPKQADWINPRTGERSMAKIQDKKVQTPDAEDWVLLLK